MAHGSTTWAQPAPSQRLHHHANRVPSRSSLFVPLVGMCIFIFAVVNASIESLNLGSTIMSVIGLALMCYRLWSASTRKRAFFLKGMTLLVLVVLVLQILPFIVSLEVLSTLFGDKCVPDLVLDALALIIVGVMACLEMPSILSRPSPLRLWKIPAGMTAVMYLLGLGVSSVFNPSIMTFPYMSSVIVSLFQIGQGKSLESVAVGRKSFPLQFLQYTACYFLLSVVLCLPGVREQMQQSSWLAQCLGVPKTDSFDYFNYSCVMPSGIALFVLAVLSPWWVEVAKSGRTGRFGGSSLGSSMEEEEDVSNTVKKSFRGNFFKKISPCAFILVPLFLPSTLSIILFLGGSVLLAFPRNKALTKCLEIFVILFFVAAFTASTLVLSGLCGSDPLYRSIGVLAPDAAGNIWSQFLLLSSLLALIAVSVIARRFDFVEPRQKFGLYLQAVIGTMRSAEVVLALVVAVVFTTAAIEKKTSIVSVIYFSIALLPLACTRWQFVSALLLGAASCAMTALTLVFFSWFNGENPTSFTKIIGVNFFKTCFLSALPHLCILLIAAMCLTLLRRDFEVIDDAVAFAVEKLKTHAIFFSRLALAIPMALSLALFVTMPFDYFSALVIVCFVVQMALLQETNRYSLQAAILRINVVQSSVLVFTVLWILVSMIPQVNQFVSSSLQFNPYISASEVGVLPNCEYLGKLSLEVALLTVSSVFRRNKFFIETTTRSSHIPSWITSNAISRKAFTLFASQLTRILMFTIFLSSVFETNFVNTVSELIVCAFLLCGRWWNQAGLFFSTLSMLLLFLQYLASMEVVSSNVADPELLRYLGMTWTGASVARNLSIFSACIVQRNVQNFVRLHFPKSESAENAYIAFLDKFAAVFTGIIFLLSAAGKSDFFSFIYLVIGAALAIRLVFSLGDARMSPLAMRILAFIVALCIAAQALVRLWFPPLWRAPARPNFSFFCAENDFACTDDYQRFFNAPSSTSGSTALLDNSDALNGIATSLGFSTPISSISKISTFFLLWDFSILWVICVLLQNHLIGRSAARIRSRSSDSVVVLARSKRRRTLNFFQIFFSRFWILLVLLASLFATFSFHETVDVFNLSYLLLTALLLWAHEKGLSARRRVIIFGILVSLSQLLLFVAYQTPVFPCKFWSASCVSSSADLTNPVRVPTSLCVQIQNSLKGCENWGAFTWPQVLIQTLGLFKLNIVSGVSVWLLLALLVQLAMYDLSDTYRSKVESDFFEKELDLRVMRARRFLVEFNSSLFLNNRKVQCLLEATHRKLVRVQQTAQVLLLGGEGSQNHHLNCESEALCSRGFSPEEADIASALSKDQPEGTGLLILETVMQFGLGRLQESEALLSCKNLLEENEPISQPTALTEYIDDICFLDDVNAAAPLSLHRKSDGYLVLLAKSIFSQSVWLVVFFALLSFVASNSVYDLLRLFLLLSLLLSWPLIDRVYWRTLLWYTFIGISLEATFQLSIFCGGSAFWRFKNVFELSSGAQFLLPCPQPTAVGWDVILGMPKMLGSGALKNLCVSGLFHVIWSDLLLLLALFMHRCRLYKSGVWEHLTTSGAVEKHSGAIIVPRKVVSETRDGDGDEDELDEENDIESAAQAEQNHQREEEDLVVGSFVDLSFQPLSAEDPQALSRFAVQRHMCSEDVFDRIFSSSFSILELLNMYKKLRWEAQIEYANTECVRMRVDERWRRNERGRELKTAGLNFVQKMYFKLNPFCACKVGADHYSCLFLIALMMFFHVVVFYPAMTGQADANIVSALKTSQFSSGLALLMFFHFVLIALDRAYYCASFRRVALCKQQIGWYFMRLFLLISLTFALHGIVLKLLFKTHQSSYSSLIARPALAVYYLEFMLYLVVSLVQLREGFPRVMKESLRPEKSYHPVTDKLQEWRFLLYRAIPFLDELRILIDWTVSKSCLDLYQYFKLEDAHSYMWLTKRELDTRRRMWPAEAIGKVEKGLMGFGFLLVLMAVIIGPVLLFSSLVSPGIVAPITAASLATRVSVSFGGDPLASTGLNFYVCTSPGKIQTMDNVQQISFGFQSDLLIQNGSQRYADFKAALDSAFFISIETLLRFQRSAPGYLGPETSISMPSCAAQQDYIHLCPSSTSASFQAMLSAAKTLFDIPDTSVVGIPNVVSPWIEIDSAGVARDAGLGNVSLALASDGNQGYAAFLNWTNSSFQYPQIIAPSGGVAQLQANGSEAVFHFILAPVQSSNGTGGALLSVGIVTIYITVVYAIGRFLRYVFDKESLRVIYLEIPRTDDLLDLATGASIARHYKDLPMEFKLYNCLIKVLRSPETLIALGGADVTGYGVGRHDDPPFPELLSLQDQERLRRRRKKKKPSVSS